MRVAGVIDLAGGRAVHARGGVRRHYVPVTTVAGIPVDGDARALAAAYVDRLALRELYVADLDAIAGLPIQQAVLAELSTLGVPLWLDAGISSIEDAQQACTAGASHVVVGLETLSSLDALDRIRCSLERGRLAFSLDLRDGAPIVLPGGPLSGMPPHVLAAEAARVGVDAIILIDLARVGTGQGLDLALVARVRAAAPGVALFAGGGVRGRADVATLAGAGCDGVLVASALHDGRLSAADVRDVGVLSANRTATRARE